MPYNNNRIRIQCADSTEHQHPCIGHIRIWFLIHGSLTLDEPTHGSILVVCRSGRLSAPGSPAVVVDGVRPGGHLPLLLRAEPRRAHVLLRVLRTENPMSSKHDDNKPSKEPPFLRPEAVALRRRRRRSPPTYLGHIRLLLQVLRGVHGRHLDSMQCRRRCEGNHQRRQRAQEISWRREDQGGGLAAGVVESNERMADETTYLPGRTRRRRRAASRRGRRRRRRAPRRRSATSRRRHEPSNPALAPAPGSLQAAAGGTNPK